MRLPRSLFMSVLVLGLSCATAAAADTAEDEVVSAERPDRWAKPIELPGAGNFWKVSDDLYRGAQPTAQGFREIEKMGIKTDVNLRSFNSDRDELEGTNLDYVHIWSKAWHPEDEDVIAFLKVVADPETHPVFVHCQHGSGRTGMMVAVYRIVMQGWSKDEAIKEMTEGGFGFHKIWRDIVEYVREVDVDALKRDAGLSEPDDAEPPTGQVAPAASR